MKRILFKDRNGLNLTQMVLTGRKTMTRRAIALPQGWKSCDVEHKHIGVFRDILYNRTTKETYEIYPKYFIGKVVAIQQAYKDVLACEHLSDEQEDEVCRLVSEGVPGCTNKMFVRADLMPHHIRITDVCCERLQDISDEDCMREGIEWLPDGARLKPYAFYDTRIKTQDGYGWYRDYDTPREAFAALIDKVSGRGTWKSDPIVWVYEFELVD